MHVGWEQTEEKQVKENKKSKRLGRKEDGTKIGSSDESVKRDASRCLCPPVAGGREQMGYR